MHIAQSRCIVGDMNGTESNKTRLGSALRGVRVAGGVTPDQLADHLGISRTTLWRIEAGLRPIPEQLYRQIIAGLNDLIGGKT